MIIDITIKNKNKVVSIGLVEVIGFDNGTYNSLRNWLQKQFLIFKYLNKNDSLEEFLNYLDKTDICKKVNAEQFVINGEEYLEKDFCIAKGDHLMDCDSDGYCNFCGEQ